MFSWFIFSLAAIVLFGVAIAFYKLPTTKQQSKTATSFWMLLFSFIFAVLVFHNHLVGVNGETLLLAAFWGLGFAILASLQMYALERIDTNVLFPVTTTLSLIVSVVLGLTLFSETLSALQIIGIVLAVASVYLFLYKKGRLQYSSYIVLIGLVVVFVSVFNKIIQKLAADAVSIETYQIYQYLFAAIFALVLFFIYNRSNLKEGLFSGAVRSGFLISIPSFLGGWALLAALTTGPFSLITSLHSTYIFVTALVGALFFKEKLTKRKLFLLLLAIAAIILIRIG